MTILKLKAKIYQYTRIFLTNKEQAEYVSSTDFALDFDTIDNDFTTEDKVSILIGSWQAENGFARPYTYEPFRAIRTFWVVLCWDIEDLFKKYFKKGL